MRTHSLSKRTTRPSFPGDVVDRLLLRDSVNRQGEDAAMRVGGGNRKSTWE